MLRAFPLKYCLTFNLAQIYRVKMETKMVEGCRETVNKMCNRKLHVTLPDAYNNYLCFKCSNKCIFPIWTCTLFCLLLQICFCATYVIHKIDAIFFNSKYLTALAAISKHHKPDSFLIHHYVVVKAIKRICQDFSSEKLDLLFPPAETGLKWDDPHWGIREN